MGEAFFSIESILFVLFFCYVSSLVYCFVMEVAGFMIGVISILGVPSTGLGIFDRYEQLSFGLFEFWKPSMSRLSRNTENLP